MSIISPFCCVCRQTFLLSEEKRKLLRSNRAKQRKSIFCERRERGSQGRKVCRARKIAGKLLISYSTREWEREHKVLQEWDLRFKSKNIFLSVRERGEIETRLEASVDVPHGISRLSRLHRYNTTNSLLIRSFFGGFTILTHHVHDNLTRCWFTDAIVRCANVNAALMSIDRLQR